MSALTVRDIVAEVRCSEFTSANRILEMLLAAPRVSEALARHHLDATELLAAVADLHDISEEGRLLREREAIVRQPITRMLALVKIPMPGSIVQKCSDLAAELIQDATNLTAVEDLRRDMDETRLASFDPTETVEHFAAKVLRRLGPRVNLSTKVEAVAATLLSE